MDKNKTTKPKIKLNKPKLTWDSYLLRKWCPSCKEGYYVNVAEDAKRHKDCKN